MNEPTTLVRVTREHIANGVIRDCERCPIALALIDALGDLFTPGSWVDVEMGMVMFCRAGEETWTAWTPDVAATFIEDFDHGDDVAPLEFTLTWTWHSKRQEDPL